MSEEVSFWVHCQKCLGECPGSISPKDYARQHIGFTPSGNAIVWCNRHECEVGRLKLSDDQAKKLEGCSCGECNSAVPIIN